MHKSILTLLLFLSCFQSFSQIEGIVSDINGNPLPYVNIYLENTYTGTISNGEGFYSLSIKEPGSYKITFQYLGFKTLKKSVDITQFPFNLNVQLTPETTSLDEVIVDAGINPANVIIRKTIDARKQNLEKISEYKADFYSRGLWRVKNAPEKILGQEVGDLGGGLDSTRTGIIYLSETISKIGYQRPNNFSEVITASKVSGDDNGFSFNSAVDANFSFYENTVNLNTEMISPIASNAFSYYRYKLVGTFYEDGHLINKIEIIPRRTKDRVFNGHIYIVEDQWQIYGLELDTTGEAIQVPMVENLKFKQNFTYDTTYAQWVKISQVIDFQFGFLGFKGDGRYNAGYSNYDFKPSFSKKSFSNEVLSFAKAANQKDSTFWKEQRPVPLTTEELEDYIKKDSLQVIRKSQKYLDSIDAERNKIGLLSPFLGQGYANTYKRWRFNYEGIAKSISFNTVQGWNGSTEINYLSWSDDDYQKTFYAFAKANYGFSDDRLRFTAGFTRRFDRIKRKTLSVSGGVETRQFNPDAPISPLINTIASLGFERNYLKIYERAFGQASYSQEIVNGLRLFVTAGYEDRKPLFNTTNQTWFPKNDIVYTSNNPLTPNVPSDLGIEKHSIAKAQITSQINFDQKYYNYPTGKFNIRDDRYPTLYLTYEKGFAASESSYNFDQLRVRLRQGFNIGNKGRLNYNVKAGTFLNTARDISFVDYQHFNGNQTRVGTEGSYLNRFNLLPYYALSTNTSYVEAHVEHDFKGWILGKIPGLNALNFNLVGGAHLLSTEGNTPYTEFSIGVDNLGWGKVRLLRLDYVWSSGLNRDEGAFIFGLKFLDLL